jgi:hypothetical protein
LNWIGMDSSISGTEFMVNQRFKIEEQSLTRLRKSQNVSERVRSPDFGETSFSTRE